MNLIPRITRILSMAIFPALLLVSAHAQLKIAATTGFPLVLSEDSTYTVSLPVQNVAGYPVALSGGISFDYKFPSSTVHRMGTSGPVTIAPGGTTVVTVTNVSFASLNSGAIDGEIIVWPTAPGFNPVDSAHIDIAVSVSAVFAMQRSFILGLPSTITSATQLSLQLYTVNIGSVANVWPVDFFMQVNEEAPVLLATYSGIAQPGDTIRVDIGAFSIADVLPSSYRTTTGGSEEPVNGTVTIWAQERGMPNSCLGTAEFNFTDIADRLSDDAYVFLFSFPNPVTDRLSLVTDLKPEQVNLIQVVNALGQEIFTLNGWTGEINTEAWMPGVYQLTLWHGLKSSHVKIVK